MDIDLIEKAYPWLKDLRSGVIVRTERAKKDKLMMANLLYFLNQGDSVNLAKKKAGIGQRLDQRLRKIYPEMQEATKEFYQQNKQKSFNQ